MDTELQTRIAGLQVAEGRLEDRLHRIHVHPHAGRILDGEHVEIVDLGGKRYYVPSRLEGRVNVDGTTAPNFANGLQYARLSRVLPALIGYRIGSPEKKRHLNVTSPTRSCAGSWGSSRKSLHCIAKQ